MSRPQKKQKTEELLRKELKDKDVKCGELRKYGEVLKEELKEANDKRLGLRRLNEGLLDDLNEARAKGNGQTGGVIYISDCSDANRGLRQDVEGLAQRTRRDGPNVLGTPEIKRSFDRRTFPVPVARSTPRLRRLGLTSSLRTRPS